MAINNLMGLYHGTNHMGLIMSHHLMVFIWYRKFSGDYRMCQFQLHTMKNTLQHVTAS